MTLYQTTIDFPKFRLAVSFHYLPGDPGRTSGPPEKCYPPEGPEFDLTECILYTKAPNGTWRTDATDLYELGLIDECSALGDLIEDACMAYLDTLQQEQDDYFDEPAGDDDSGGEDNGVR